MTALYFYRANLFNISSQVIDDSSNTNPIDDFETGTVQALATATQMGIDGNGNSWVDFAQVGNVVDDGGQDTTGDGVVDVAVDHIDQGRWAANQGPPNDQAIQASYHSIATSGINPATGALQGLEWTLADPSPLSGPGNTLPAGEIIQTTFTSNYSYANPANSAGISMILLSGTMDVSINEGGPGIVITDPNSAAVGIQLPPGYMPPPGSVVYFDPTYGLASTGAATEVLQTPLGTTGGGGGGAGIVSTGGGSTAGGGGGDERALPPGLGLRLDDVVSASPCARSPWTAGSDFLSRLFHLEH